MPTNRELTQAVAKEFKLSVKKTAAFLKQKQINPEATAYTTKQIQPGRLKTILKKLPKAIKESGMRVRNLTRRDDDLRREIKQNLEKLAMTGIEQEVDDKTNKVKPHKREPTPDYLEKIRHPEIKKEEAKETALTSGSALARQAEPSEARAEKQPAKAVHVELAPGFEKIEAVGRGEGEPTAPDIG